MDRQRVVQVVAVLLVVAVGALALVASGLVPVSLYAPGDSEYERTTVTAYDENGTRLGQVEVRVAETQREQYVGLSNTGSMPADEGMLFPYDRASNHTFVMRDMAFGLDIVYIGSNGTITSISHAPLDGEYRHPGYGQYVLEVNLGWTTEHGVEAGDRVVIEGYVDGAERTNRIEDEP